MDRLEQSVNFPLVENGFDHLLMERYGRFQSGLMVRLTRIAVLVLATWIPLLLLSLASREALNGQDDIPLLHDPAMYGRFLFVLPVLEMAEVVVGMSLVVQVRHFVESGIVPPNERPRFEAAIKEVLRIRCSPYTEMAIAILSLGISISMRLMVVRTEVSNWERLGSTITPAGWWYALVSLPVLLFFLIRWFCIFTLWSWFLFRVSRLDLQLTPTHPDHAGGLGFLGWGLASFSAVVMAFSAVISAGFAYEILRRNESLNSLKYHVIVFVVLVIAVLHLPLLAFSNRMSRCRFTGLLDYSNLVLRHDRAFDEKWIKQTVGDPKEPLLGSPDIQTLAAIATVYDHVDDMLLIPFDKKAVGVLLFSALLPMVPLVATVIPLKEIMTKLVELIV